MFTHEIPLRNTKKKSIKGTKTCNKLLCVYFFHGHLRDQVDQSSVAGGRSSLLKEIQLRGRKLCFKYKLTTHKLISTFECDSRD